MSRVGIRFVLVLAVLVVSACTSGESVETTSTKPLVATSVTSESVSTTVANTTTTSVAVACPTRFCVTYHIRPAALWSDQTPVTAADFVFTYESFLEASVDVGVRAGYEEIESVEVVDDKTVRVVFKQGYGAWRTLFDRVLPAHISDPGDLSVTASGFTLETANEAEVVLRSNPDYWSNTDALSGGLIGDVDRLVFVSRTSPQDQLSALARGEVDVINPRPTPELLRSIERDQDLTYQIAQGAFWEHIDFNHSDPLLSQSWVREVIAFSIDREQILDETIREIDPTFETRESAVWPNNSVNYLDHYRVGFDPARSLALLEEHFCDKATDGIYDCQGRRMSFVWVTTTRDDYRRIQAELVRDTLDDSGIEIILTFLSPSDMLSADVFFADSDTWQIINFSWKSSADPHTGDTRFFCEGDAPNGYGLLNVNRYCNETVDAAVRQAGLTVESRTRADLYNSADETYLEDLAIIPLYQKPEMLAWNARLSGPELNSSGASDTWNVITWAGLDEVTVGLDALPVSFDPRGVRTGRSDMVLAPLTAGAFGVTPSLEFVPVLIESVEVFVGGS